jgi:hypothetical protein
LIDAAETNGAEADGVEAEAGERVGGGLPLGMDVGALGLTVGALFG